MTTLRGYRKRTKNPKQILESAHSEAVDVFKKDKGESFLESLDGKARNWCEIIARKSENQKGVIAALITSLTKKIQTPTQDVRYHKVELSGGYSARTFDTQHITPFLKEKFRRISMEESGWLTRSIEQPHPFTLDFPGKIKDKQVKTAFLKILNDIEENKADPRQYLVSLFILLIKDQAKIQTLISKAPILPAKRELAIDLIINFLESHFFYKYGSPGASKLPALAIFSLYQIITQELARYQNKKLEPLRSHLSADMREGRIGDVEVIDKSGKCFEAVEIKYGKPITLMMVKDAYEKFKLTPVNRYYLLTTAEPYIVEEERKDVNRLLHKIKREHGCEVIINGIIPSIKYYLRLIREPTQFLAVYTDNLKSELLRRTEIKKEHMKRWLKILKGQ